MKKARPQDAKKGRNALTQHQSSYKGGKNQPGVERAVMDLSGPRAFELQAKKPEPDGAPKLKGLPSVNSGRRTKAALVKRLGGKRI